MSLASEFHRGTRAASQVHTSLIEKAAVGPRRPRRLAGRAVQPAQTSRENGVKKKKEKEKPDTSSVCFPISLLHVQSGCDNQVGVKQFYGQDSRARTRENPPAEAARERFGSSNAGSRGQI